MIRQRGDLRAAANEETVTYNEKSNIACQKA
jgi:hypothetical protein